VTSDESVEAAVKEVLRLEGRIDLLVNNAGFSVAPAGAEESSIEQAKSMFDTNFFGIVRMTRAVVPHMRSQGSGRIINIGSVLGFLPAPYMALYSAAKHAVEGYSESLDHELRTRGIRVIVVEPAYTSTARFVRPWASGGRRCWRPQKSPESWPTSCWKPLARRARNSDTPRVSSRAACDCFADLRLPA
jgi:NAD(P)-dependent dehydrogenase (short-subunit alcohol dehydrogenase family)